MAIYDLLRPNKYVSREEYQRRLKLCNDCPERLKEIYRDMLKFGVCYDTEILDDEGTGHITLVCRGFNEWVVK